MLNLISSTDNGDHGLQDSEEWHINVVKNNLWPDNFTRNSCAMSLGGVMSLGPFSNGGQII